MVNYEKILDNSGELFVKRMKYTSDYEGTDDFSKVLKARKMDGIPIEIITSRHSNVLSAEKYLYKNKALSKVSLLEFTR